VAPDSGRYDPGHSASITQPIPHGGPGTRHSDPCDVDLASTYGGPTTKDMHVVAAVGKSVG